MNTWEKRALLEIKAANLQETLALRDSLPIYLTQLCDALSTNIDRTSARKRFDKEASARIGQKHGRERAGSVSYTMDQMIMEYHILRQVICDVLEKDKPLTDVEMEVITCSVEQAVNDAATEFSDTLRDIQEQFSQTLAHDLRSPLTSAKMSAQMILRKAGTDAFYIEKATHIANNMDRIDKMIVDLLDVSRLRAGEPIKLEFSPCDLDKIMREVGDELYSDVKLYPIISSEGSCLGNWNEDGLRRLIENLASNAVKYGKPSGAITLSLIQTKTKATIMVHNEGDPIPHSEQPGLFEQYKRSKSAQNKTGWGLGLTVVRGMVDAHRGTLSLISEKGQGTSFIVELPKDPKSL